MLQRDHDIYASAPMRALMGDQMGMIDPHLQRCSGSHALLLRASEACVAPVLPLLGCWVQMTLKGLGYTGDVHADAAEPLPFVDDAYDLVVLSHVLESAPAMPLLLDATRVLAPGGMLVLMGMHPLSAWMPWFYWRTRGTPCGLHMPWRLIRELRNEFEIERVQRVGRMWPAKSSDGSRSSPPGLGGGYVLIARKQRRIITPLRLRPRAPLRVPANGRLSPGASHSAAA